MKICRKCNNELSLENFHSKKDTKDGLHNNCKKCRKFENSNKVKYIYDKKIELGGKCVKCGYDNILCLEFHHLYDKVKIVNRLYNLDDIDNEINKCQLLCSFCHHLETKHKKNRNYIIERNYNYINSIKLDIECCNNCDKTVTLENSHAFHFDHLADKYKNVSYLCKNGYSINTIKNEINKCQLLCSNCHKLKTIKQFNLLNYLN